MSLVGLRASMPRSSGGRAVEGSCQIGRERKSGCQIGMAVCLASTRCPQAGKGRRCWGYASKRGMKTYQGVKSRPLFAFFPGG
jgi:hypothetical protein